MNSSSSLSSSSSSSSSHMTTAHIQSQTLNNELSIVFESTIRKLDQANEWMQQLQHINQENQQLRVQVQDLSLQLHSVQQQNQVYHDWFERLKAIDAASGLLDVSHVTVSPVTPTETATPSVSEKAETVTPSDSQKATTRCSTRKRTKTARARESEEDEQSDSLHKKTRFAQSAKPQRAEQASARREAIQTLENSQRIRMPYESDGFPAFHLAGQIWRTIIRLFQRRPDLPLLHQNDILKHVGTPINQLRHRHSTTLPQKQLDEFFSFKFDIQPTDLWMTVRPIENGEWVVCKPDWLNDFQRQCVISHK